MQLRIPPAIQGVQTSTAGVLAWQASAAALPATALGAVWTVHHQTRCSTPPFTSSANNNALSPCGKP
jgi:hypothetical protein